MKEIMKRNEVEIPLVRERKLDKLDGVIFEPEGQGPFPAVVFYHGRASDMKGYLPIGEELAQVGIITLAFNFSSDELFQREIDAENAYFFLQTYHQVDGGNIGILGVSMGAYHAAIMASRFQARSLILRAPDAYLQLEKSPSIRVIRDFRGSLLIIESEHDEIIPHEVIELYLKNARKARRKELKVLRDATHWLGELDSPFRQEFKRMVVDWFVRTLK